MQAGGAQPGFPTPELFNEAAKGLSHPKRPGWREHRLVCLPDFQGVGIGTALSARVVSWFRAAGKRYRSTTSHAAFIRHRLRSPLWKCLGLPSLNTGGKGMRGLDQSRAADRLTASFEYVGPVRAEEAWQMGVLGSG